MSAFLASLALRFSGIGSLLKAIPQWVWFALFGLVALYIFGHVQYGRGRHSRDTEVAAIQHDRDTWKANAAALDAAVARQNAALNDVGRRATDAQKRTGEALARLQQADRAAASMRDKARALAAVVPTGTCASPDGDKLSRESWAKL